MKQEVTVGGYIYDLNISSSGNFSYYTADIGKYKLVFRAKRYSSTAFRASFGKLCVEGVAYSSQTFMDIFVHCLEMMGLGDQE